MKSKLADDVIHAYIETILQQIGPSRFILTDNGTEFKNDTMNSVFVVPKLGIYPNLEYTQS